MERGTATQGKVARAVAGADAIEIKAPIVQAAAAVGGFMAFLAEVGAEHDKNEQTKTRWAVEYYAAKLKRPPPRKTPARKTATTATARRPARKASPPTPRRRPAR